MVYCYAANKHTSNLLRLYFESNVVIRLQNGIISKAALPD